MNKVLVIFSILALALSACAQTPTASNAEAEKTQTTASIAPSPPVSAQSPTKLPSVAAIKPRVMLEPTVVVGRTDAEIKKAFGDPNLRRQDSPAEVWQYLAQQCALHLFFYPKSSGEALVVRHIAINGRSVDTFSDLDRKQCFNNHLRAVGAEEAFISKKTS